MLCTLALIISVTINVYVACRAIDANEMARDERHLNYSRMIELQFRLDAFARKAELVTRFETKLQKLLIDVETLYSNQVYLEKALAEVVKGIVSDGIKDKPN